MQYLSNIPFARLVISLSTALLLARNGLRKQSLDSSGAMAAVVVGFLSMGASYRFGATLLFFYYSSSKLTKIGKGKKQELEESVKGGEGQRNWVQVLSCSAAGVCMSTAHVAIFGFNADDGIVFHSQGSKLSASLRCAYLGFFAACTADTWGSELGMLSSQQPYLLLSCRRCPPGTNGGVTVLGTVAGAVGGVFTGLIFWAFGYLQQLSPWEFNSPSAQKAQHELYPLLIIGLVCGLSGSIFDSLLGETMQASWINISTKQVCGHGLSDQHAGKYKLIAGRDLLTNEQVNVVSTVAAGVVGVFMAFVLDTGSDQSGSWWASE